MRGQYRLPQPQSHQVAQLQNSVCHNAVSSSLDPNTATDIAQSAPAHSKSASQASDNMQEESSHDRYMKDDLRQHNFSSISGKSEAKGIIREPLSIETSERDKYGPVIIIDLEENPDGVEVHSEENSEQERFTTGTTDEPEGLSRKGIPEQEPDLMQSQYLELQIIEELRGKAMGLKKRLLQRFVRPSRILHLVYISSSSLFFFLSSENKTDVQGESEKKDKKTGK